MASLGSQAASTSSPQVVDLSQQTDTEASRDAQTGRKQASIRSEEYITIGDSNNTSHRPGAKCKHCQQQFTPKEATPNALLKHITSACQRVPKEIKQKWQLHAAGPQASSRAGERAVLAGKRKLVQLDVGRYMGGSGDIDPPSWQLTDEEKQDISFSLLRFAVTADVAFTQMGNNPHLAYALHKMRPHYQLPSATTWAVLLDKEYHGVLSKLLAKINMSDNLTLALDAWTDARKRSIIAFVVLFKDRTSRLLETREVSLDRHTGEFIAGAADFECEQAQCWTLLCW